jgi:hypothetical protein
LLAIEEVDACFETKSLKKKIGRAKRIPVVMSDLHDL